MSWRDPRLDDAHTGRRFPAAAPPPPRLTLIRELGHPVEHLADLQAAAARICELRPKGHGLRLPPTFGDYGGAATFESVAIYTLPKDADMEDWRGSLVLPHAERPALMAAVRDHAAALRDRRVAA